MYVKLVAYLSYVAWVKEAEKGRAITASSVGGGGFATGGGGGVSPIMNANVVTTNVGVEVVDDAGGGGGILFPRSDEPLLTPQEVCDTVDRFSMPFLCVLLVVVAAGLSVNLFIVVVISWYPELYTSKHIGQAYSLVSNMVTLASTAFIVLCSFVPNPHTCSLTLVLSFASFALFLLSEATLQADFYTAIIFPFWHEHHVDKDVCLRWCAASSVLAAIATAALYFSGPLSCDDMDPESACYLIPIINQTRSGEISLTLLCMYAALFLAVILFSFHVFFVATQKLRANNKVGPKTATATASNGKKKHQHLLQKTGSSSGLLLRFDFGGGDPEVARVNEWNPVLPPELLAMRLEPFTDPGLEHNIAGAFLRRCNEQREQLGEPPLDPPPYERGNYSGGLVTGCVHHRRKRSRRGGAHKSDTTVVPATRHLLEESDSSCGSSLSSDCCCLTDKNENCEGVVGGKVNGGVVLAADELEKKQQQQPNALPLGNGGGGGASNGGLGGGGELTGPQALVKAFTKSFRLSVVDISSYLLFVSATFGVVACSVRPWSVPACSAGDDVYLNIYVRSLFVLAFALLRSAQPIFLLMTDKALWKKIGDIVRHAKKLGSRDTA